MDEGLLNHELLLEAMKRSCEDQAKFMEKDLSEAARRTCEEDS